jgi:hypothetical protein
MYRHPSRLYRAICIVCLKEYSHSVTSFVAFCFSVTQRLALRVIQAIKKDFIMEKTSSHIVTAAARTLGSKFKDTFKEPVKPEEFHCLIMGITMCKEALC